MDGQIVATGLTKIYPRVRAVDGLSFTVEPGRVTGFLGPNGSGKTTTLRMLLNLVTPTSGTATIGGRRYADLSDPLATAGAVLEASSAHKGRSARDHLRVTCAAAGYPERRVDEVLDLVGLAPAARRRYGGYSLGMRQRLGIASAMLGDPRVLILDEPANGLDPEGIRWIREFLRAFASQGRTAFVSSHLLSEMEQLADDVIIIAEGRLVAQGRVNEVVGRGSITVRVRTPQPDPLARRLLELGGLVTAAPPDGLMVTGLTGAEVGHAAFAVGVELHQLVEERPDLEEIFLGLTRGKAALR
jgi:ABC-2 type transport system ATP-binding protein